MIDLCYNDINIEKYYFAMYRFFNERKHNTTISSDKSRSIRIYIVVLCDIYSFFKKML